jgi:hypothetical protein
MIFDEPMDPSLLLMAIAIFSIFKAKSITQLKPVDAPYAETGGSYRHGL